MFCLGAGSALPQTSKVKQPHIYNFKDLPADGKIYRVKHPSLQSSNVRASHIGWAGLYFPTYLSADTTTTEFSQDLKVLKEGGPNFVMVDALTLVVDGKGHIYLTFRYTPPESESIKIELALDAHTAQTILEKIQDMIRIRKGWVQDVKSGKGFSPKRIDFKPLTISSPSELGYEGATRFPITEIQFALKRYESKVAVATWALEVRTDDGNKLCLTMMESLKSDSTTQLLKLDQYLRRSIDYLNSL